MNDPLRRGWDWNWCQVLQSSQADFLWSSIDWIHYASPTCTWNVGSPTLLLHVQTRGSFEVQGWTSSTLSTSSKRDQAPLPVNMQAMLIQMEHIHRVLLQQKKKLYKMQFLHNRLPLSNTTQARRWACFSIQGPFTPCTFRRSGPILHTYETVA